MGFKYLNVERQQGIERLVLNRPDVRNAFNEGMIAELTWWADSVSSDRSVRLVIIEGAGPVFCAGADLEWMAGWRRSAASRTWTMRWRRRGCFRTLDRLPVPVIGRVHGAALGGGAGLAAICDIVIAADNCRVRVHRGPARADPRCDRAVRHGEDRRSASRELFLTGERFSAARARELGLVHSVVSLAVSTSRSRGIATRCCAGHLAQSQPPNN
jgi:methylglutaconyl-CoA hydratase